MDKHGRYTKTGTLGDADDTVVAERVPGANDVSFTLAGTFAGITANFEVSFDDGTTYTLIDCVKVNDTSTSETSPSGLSSAGTWSQSIPAGATHLRVRASAYTSGTVNVLIAQAKS